MSRVGKLPISLPKGVDVKVEKDKVVVKGPKGSVDLAVHAAVTVTLENGSLAVAPAAESRVAQEQHGLRRTLLANAVHGVTVGFEKSLEVIGTGYRVNVQGHTVVLNVGFSHPVNFALPKDVQAKADNNKITISGCDKQLVGEVAACIRRIRPPEPYKGKGIKYTDEVIHRKAGKSGGKK